MSPCFAGESEVVLVVRSPRIKWFNIVSRVSLSAGLHLLYNQVPGIDIVRKSCNDLLEIV